MAAAAAWDVLAKAANLAQMSGLHAAMLVAVLTTLLRVHQSNKQECARLELCHRRLRALLQWPTTTTTGCGGVVLLLCTGDTGEDPFGKALGDAAGLVDAYRKSTLWRRVRSGGSTARQLRDMQDVLNSYCGLLLFVNAHILLQQHAVHDHHHHQSAVPTSPDTSATTIPEANDDMSQSPSAPANRDTHRANGIGLGGIDTDPATGCETNVPALLPIVISHA